MSRTFSKLINHSFLQGTFPDVLKIAKFIQFFKKGSTFDYQNYRPISVLSNIDKIMQKRITEFLEKFYCLSDLQFGFQKGHSIAHALITLTETIRKALDNGDYVSGVFVDLQKSI